MECILKTYPEAVLSSRVMTAIRFGWGLAFAVSVLLCAPRVGLACAGDCDWSGQVDIGDLVRMVNVALDRQPVTQCVAGDRDRSGAVRIDEVAGAVQSALRGCEPVPRNALAAASLSVARAVSYLTRITPAIGLAYDGAGGSTPCELGGVVEGVCEDVGPSALRATVTTTDCHDYTHETPMGYYGSAVVSGQGGCSAVLLPANIRFEFAWDVVNETAEGEPLFDTRMDAVVTLRQFLFGPAPCAIKGGIATFDGDMTFSPAAGGALAAHFEATSARTDFADFAMEYGCEPLTLTIAADGLLRLRDTFGAGPLEVEAWSEGLTATIDRSARSVTLTGAVKGDCFDGTAHISTIEPLTFLVGESCFNAGKLRIETPAGASLVTIGGDTAIDIDADADGSADLHYDSCASLPAACGAGL